MASGYLIFLSTTIAVLTLDSNSDYIGLGVGGLFFTLGIVYQVALCKVPHFFG